VVYRLLADAVVLGHLVFVAFVVAGGLLCLRWPRAGYVHLPAAIWGIAIEWSGGVCPLTPLENGLRRLGGAAGYGGGFVEHYLIPVLYPAALTRGTQLALGVVVLGVNVVIYAMCWRRRRAA